MKTTRTAPWMCSLCGYVMDAASPAYGGGAVPKRGDLAICLNCGHPYTLDGSRWRHLTGAEFAALKPEERRQLTMARTAQAIAGFPDLAKRGGRA